MDPPPRSIGVQGDYQQHQARTANHVQRINAINVKRSLKLSRVTKNNSRVVRNSTMFMAISSLYTPTGVAVKASIAGHH